MKSFMTLGLITTAPFVGILAKAYFLSIFPHVSADNSPNIHLGIGRFLSSFGLRTMSLISVDFRPKGRRNGLEQGAVAMDVFENLVADILWRQGYWVRTSVWVN